MKDRIKKFFAVFLIGKAIKPLIKKVINWLTAGILALGVAIGMSVDAEAIVASLRSIEENIMNFGLGLFQYLVNLL